MAQWLTRLAAVELNSVANDDRGLWILSADLSFYSDIAEHYWLGVGKTPDEAKALAVLTAPKGFKTDFMSVPPEVPECSRLARSRRAGALHDWLYTTPHFINNREICDSILKEMFIEDAKEDGETDLISLNLEADLVYAGVRAGGASHWD